MRRKRLDDRRLWMARSTDGGRGFAKETAAFGETTGVCGCRGSRAVAGADGSLYVLFRSATQIVHRDMWLLSSADHGSTFHGSAISQWNIGACVMSPAALVDTSAGILAGWESEKQVYFGRVAAGTIKVAGVPVGAPGIGDVSGKNRKYPALAINAHGETLFAWTEDMAWKKGGSAAWQVYDQSLRAGR